MTAQIRADLAAAASTVEGLQGHAYFLQTTEPGNVLIRLERVEFPNPFGGVGHFNVVLILPQDQAAAEKYIEEHVPGLIEAVEPHIVVTSYVPQQLEIKGLGILPTVFINGHREV